MQRIYFTNNENNKRIAKILEKKLKFRCIPVKISEAREFLPKVKGKAVLLWGDGSEHHLSYFFEKRANHGRRALKIGIDAHTDMARYEELDCGNHFYYSGIRDHDVFVYLPYWRGIQVGDEMSLKKPGEKYSHKHISVDLDFLKGFPVESYFSCGTGTLEAVLELLNNELDKTVERFDIGGLKHDANRKEFKKGLEIYLRIFEILSKNY